MKKTEFKNLEQVSDAAAKKFAELSKQAIKERGFFAVALSGGNTPKETYEILAGEYADKIDWKNIYIFFSDERMVPYDSEDSNFANANQVLLSRVDLPTENIYRFQTELGLSRAAEDYETAILDFFQNHQQDAPVFDLIMLGIGEDGHVASLFPDEAVLDEGFNLVAGTKASDDSDRLTMTFPLINRARQRLVLAGEDKAKIISKWEKGSNIPAAKLVEDTEVYCVSA